MSLFRQFPQPALSDADVQLCARWAADPGLPGSIAKGCLKLGIMTARQRAVLWDADGGGFRSSRESSDRDPDDFAELDFDRDFRGAFGNDEGDR